MIKTRMMMKMKIIIILIILKMKVIEIIAMISINYNKRHLKTHYRNKGAFSYVIIQPAIARGSLLKKVNNLTIMLKKNYLMRKLRPIIILKVSIDSIFLNS